MSERFVRFDIGEYMFCYDVCDNQLLVDSPECNDQLSIFMEPLDMTKLNENLEKIKDWFILQDEITTLDNLRMYIEDMGRDYFHSLSSTINRLETIVGKLEIEIEEALQ